MSCNQQPRKLCNPSPNAPKDPGGQLELHNLNILMGSIGISKGCELIFYTHVMAYAVTFGPSGSFQIERYNRFLGFWEMVMFSGTMPQTTSALNSYGPFLTPAQAAVVWANTFLPPEPPFSGFLPDPV